MRLLFSWSIGVFLGMVISCGVSGGHLNPAVSVALASLGKLSWLKVRQSSKNSPDYWASLGASLSCCPVPWSFYCLFHSVSSLLGCFGLVWTWQRSLSLSSWNSCHILHIPFASSFFSQWNRGPISRNLSLACLYLCFLRQTVSGERQTPNEKIWLNLRDALSS